MRLFLKFTMALVGLWAGIAPAAAPYRDPADHFFQPFLGDLRAEIADARSNGRKGVVVMYHFEECPYCTRMKNEVLSRPDVQDWYRSEFTVLGIDTRGAQPITGLDGKTLLEKDYAAAVRVKGTPSFDFYGADGEHLYRHVGALYDPAEFLLLGRYVATGAHRKQTFQEYRQAARSPGKP
jgi:thioredoxin-related protein